MSDEPLGILTVDDLITDEKRYNGITKKEAASIIAEWTNYENELTYEYFSDGSVGIYTDSDVSGIWVPHR